MKDFESDGVWWAPERPTELLSGRLRYSAEEGTYLKVHGYLKTAPPSDTEPTDLDVGLQDAFPSPVVAHGTLDDGRPVTLCRVAKRGSNVGTVPTAVTYEVAYVLLGAHVSRSELTSILSVQVAFSGLREWVGKSPIRQILIENLGPDSEANRRGLHIEALQRVTLSSSVSTQIGEVSVVGTTSGGLGTGDELAVHQQVWFDVAMPRPTPLTHLLEEVVSPLQNFLTLGVGSPVSLIELRVTCEVAVAPSSPDVDVVASSGEPQLTGRRRISLQVGLETSRRTHPDAKRRRAWARQMVFSQADLGDRWREVLETFLAFRASFRPVYNIFFATLYGSELYLENRFLNFAHAAESYHRRTHSNPPFSEDAFAVIKHAVETALDQLAFRIPNNIPGDIVDALKEKVAFWNEHSLIERLDALFPADDQQVGALSGGTMQFLSLVRRARNYHTHYPETGDTTALTPEALVIAMMRLEALIRLLLLRHIAVPDSVIAAWVANEAKRISEVRRADAWEAL